MAIPGDKRSPVVQNSQDDHVPREAGDPIELGLGQSLNFGLGQDIVHLLVVGLDLPVLCGEGSHCTDVGNAFLGHLGSSSQGVLYVS